MVSEASLHGNDFAVRTANVVRSYGSVSSPVLALRGVSLEIRRGERVACLGKSGSGKSTLMNLLGGLDRPSSGTIWAVGCDLARMSATQLAQYRLVRVGMIFQAYNLVPSRTALQNVELPLIFAGQPPRLRRRTAQKALEAVGLGQRLGHRPNELSGGEQQRVAIARALVNQPDLLLADEPTGNLDTETAREVAGLLLDHCQEHGTTLFLVTHDEELARQCADRVVSMKDGLIVS
jgi:ABC-type lipoprotein export system ATPase subunit